MVRRLQVYSQSVSTDLTSKANVLNWYRNTLLTGPRMALCRTPAEWLKVAKSLKLEYPTAFLSEGAGAETKIITYKGALVCVICIGSTKGHTKHEINALLVHEATHVWQQFCNDIGEKNPGAEQEAYAIQRISQNLMQEFWDK